ncbi:hypothetical protein C8R44DRAFT_747523 [Mycena epipterygia]|nr:hypothetical protein C8R44DRAFT_747523 [Mycena epipterygia]
MLSSNYGVRATLIRVVGLAARRNATYSARRPGSIAGRMGSASAGTRSICACVLATGVYAGASGLKDSLNIQLVAFGVRPSGDETSPAATSDPRQSEYMQHVSSYSMFDQYEKNHTREERTMRLGAFKQHVGNNLARTSIAKQDQEHQIKWKEDRRKHQYAGSPLGYSGTSFIHQRAARG